MRLNLRLVDPKSGSLDDVVVTAEAETPLADVEAVLGTVQPGRLFRHGAPLVPNDGVRLSAGGLLDGDEITVGAPGRIGGDRKGATLELAVVGGPMSGRTWPLPIGTWTIGRSSQADIVLREESISRQHCRLSVDDEGCTVEDLGSTNGTWVGGVRLTGAVKVRSDQDIEVGPCLLEVRLTDKADADLHPDGAGGLAFNRPARIRPARQSDEVSFSGRRDDPTAKSFPWAQIAIPAIPAVAGLLFWGPQALLFPVVAVANLLYGRRRDAKKNARDAARCAVEMDEAEARLLEAAERELVETHGQFPDPPTLAAIAIGPTSRLWERREYDPDATLLRVGVADRAASVVVKTNGDDRDLVEPRLPTMPVGVDLARAGVLGIAGAEPRVRATARWLVAQLATLRSPRDLQLVVLAGASAAPDWDWLRWLPHLRVEDPGGPLALVGNDGTTREERVKELLETLDVRVEVSRDQPGTRFSPTVVVVFDGILALRSVPGVPRLLREGPPVGMYAIGLDSDVNRLAEEGRAQIVLHPDDADLGTLEVDGVAAVSQVLLDQVDESWADGMARALSAIRDPGGEEGEAVIPRSARFVDLARIDLEHPDDVAERWAQAGRTTEAMVGVSIDGPFVLDLKGDGPHALVAGTTGSGKSEFLQTLVASLAFANRPAAMNFVLVDYKGASAFADCERLPHTVGMVTNLDGHLTERALVSLDAELKRRERVLKDLAVPDIDSAWRKAQNRAEEAGLARLVLVIDEFAELVRELPDFVSGLIRIARVGRSLGIHLILATQRPAGVVSPEMRANTGLRVAFRMEDKADSSEVLDAPNAATITRATPGRGFVRSGARSALIEFQTARVAGRRVGASEDLPPPRVDIVPWNRLGYPLAGPTRAAPPPGDATDLHALVEIIGAAAAKSALPRPASPWLPPLPTMLTLPVLSPEEDRASGQHLEPVTIGLEDIPFEQAQRPATYDLASGASMLIVGSARSGRSSALRTVAASLARSTSPADLHLYGLDFGNGALLALTDLPHCGAIVMGSETGRVERLVNRVLGEMGRRQELLARTGLGDIGEQRQAGPAEKRLPYLIVLVDRWEGFLADYSIESGSELPSAILRVVREGAGVGIAMIVAGDRSLLIDRLASQVEDKLVLRLADRDDFRIVNLNPKNIPEEIPPGRAFRAASGTEVQFSLLDDDPSGQAQAAAIRRIAADAVARWPEERRLNRPFRVDILPTTLGFEQAWSMSEGIRPASPLWALVGVGGDELAPVGVDLAAEGGFIIAGESKSGRSTALTTMARSIVAGGGTVVAICPRPSPLSDLGQAPVDRLHLVKAATDPGELEATLNGVEGPMAILVDDAEALARSPSDDAINDFLNGTGLGRAAVVVAGQLDDLKTELRGTIVKARKARAALLLSPQSTLDGDLVGLRLPRSTIGRMPPGRGVLGLHGDTTVIQVPR